MRKLLTALLFTFLCTYGFAQEKNISGKVTDSKSGLPVPGVSVMVRGTNNGTVTNANGDFKLSVNSSAKVLVFSSVGFQTQEVAIGNSTSIAIKLVSSETALQEVVVVGYSRSTKEAFTGAAKVVAGENLTNKAVGNVSQALAGEVAGVRVINTSGQPGTTATIRIRGIGSVNGNRDPLYVVDGVPYSGTISSINPDDISNITVLKDAAATAIYGSRGANGVIVITTKTGRGKQPFITVDAKYGSNRSLLPRYDVIRSPEQFIGLAWEAMYNYAVSINNANPTNYANTNLFTTGSTGINAVNNIWNVASAAQLIDPTTRTVLPGVTRKFDPEYWGDYAFQPSTRAEANVQFGGGDNKTNYYSSFGYLKDVGSLSTPISSA